MVTFARSQVDGTWACVGVTRVDFRGKREKKPRRKPKAKNANWRFRFLRPVCAPVRYGE